MCFNIISMPVSMILKQFPSVHLSDQNDTDNLSQSGLIYCRGFKNRRWHNWQYVCDGKSNHRKPTVIISTGNHPGSALPTLLCEYHLLLWNCSYPRSQGQCQRPVFLHSISSELHQKHMRRVTDHRCNTGLAMNDVLQEHVSSVPG